MNRETTETKTDEARMNDMDILMSLVNEKRTLIQFQMAEKIVKTYRIKAPSFRAAKGMIDNTISTTALTRITMETSIVKWTVGVSIGRHTNPSLTRRLSRSRLVGSGMT